MGRTLATTTQLILNERKEFTHFRRALRRSDQAAFDELFAYARQHVAAITMASHALPFEPECDPGLNGVIPPQIPPGIPLS